MTRSICRDREVSEAVFGNAVKDIRRIEVYFYFYGVY